MKYFYDIFYAACFAFCLFLFSCSGGQSPPQATPAPDAPAPDAPGDGGAPPDGGTVCDGTKLAARDLTETCRAATPTMGALEAQS